MPSEHSCKLPNIDRREQEAGVAFGVGGLADLAVGVLTFWWKLGDIKDAILGRGPCID